MTPEQEKNLRFFISQNLIWLYYCEVLKETPMPAEAQETCFSQAAEAWQNAVVLYGDSINADEDVVLELFNEMGNSFMDEQNRRINEITGEIH